MKLSEAIIAAKKEGKVPIIAEVKRKIPKLKNFHFDGSAGKMAKKYTDAGAIAISVVVEPEFFGGRTEDICDIKKCSSLPLLVKDFTRSEEQIEKFKEHGADCVLLIAAHLNGKLKCLIEYSQNIGMEALVEIKSLDELDYVMKLNHRFIEINNRNIDAFEKDEGDVQRTKSIAKFAKNCIVISASSIQTTEDIKIAMQYGSDAVLVGTALMLSENPQKTIKKFMKL
ncbi:MAG: indole-3-glycerol-phosphate synthase TrpC [Candidatus Nanohalarchaeota archaeon]|nr:MAG: indole-3-glycerol-phosphate synthase TrpC [Candidatus Nanohaloarchaeota archaeon]